MLVDQLWRRRRHARRLLLVQVASDVMVEVGSDVMCRHATCLQEGTELIDAHHLTPEARKRMIHRKTIAKVLQALDASLAGVRCVRAAARRA
jgi:hypothetical protein